jgi:hypothetical protein
VDCTRTHAVPDGVSVKTPSDSPSTVKASTAPLLPARVPPGAASAAVPDGNWGKWDQRPPGAMAKATGRPPGEPRSTSNPPLAPTDVERTDAAELIASGVEAVHGATPVRHRATSERCPDRAAATSAVIVGPVASSRSTAVADLLTDPPSVTPLNSQDRPARVKTPTRPPRRQSVPTNGVPVGNNATASSLVTAQSGDTRLRPAAEAKGDHDEKLPGVTSARPPAVRATAPPGDPL